MEYFNVTADFLLVGKPTWLDGFRKRYDQSYPLHITLKNLTEIDKNDIPELKKKLQNIIQKYSQINLKFEKLFTSDKSSKGVCIMILTNQDKSLMNMQRDISRGLSRFGKHVLKEYKDFEENFLPHTTIARGLSEEEFRQAKKEIQKKVSCKGKLSEITLTIVKEINFENLNKRENKTYFKLKDE